MENLVEIKNNQIVTTSRQVADSFGKQHKHVLESIQGILHSAEKSAQWFYPKRRKTPNFSYGDIRCATSANTKASVGIKETTIATMALRWQSRKNWR